MPLHMLLHLCRQKGLQWLNRLLLLEQQGQQQTSLQPQLQQQSQQHQQHQQHKHRQQQLLRAHLLLAGVF
jgi:hypothetical protein